MSSSAATLNVPTTKKEPQLVNYGESKPAPMTSPLHPRFAAKSALRIPAYPGHVVWPVGNSLARRHYAGGAPPENTAKQSNNSPISDVDAKPAALRKFRGPPDGKTTPLLVSQGPHDPKAAALSILDSLPLNSIVTKGGLVVGGAGAIVWMISKEIYIFNEDSILCLCFFTLLYLVIRFCSGPMQQFYLDRHIHVWNILQQARDRHREIIKSRIDEVDKMSDIVDVTRNLFDMSKDMAKLEAQSFELKQKLALHNEVKAVLDSWVRHEAAVRQREQSEIARTVIERVRERLQDPRVQEQILQQAVVDVERLVAK